MLLYYGTTIFIDDTFYIWYNGEHGPFNNDVNFGRENCVICYATSRDGVNWEKPELGLVEGRRFIAAIPGISAAESSTRWHPS